MQPIVPASVMADTLLSWYDANKRTLPWREDASPYHVWLSEIMLQQTQVQAVIPYYHRFLEAMPSISTLATATEDELHKLWEGLGYYSRVDRLHEAAVLLTESYDALLPERYEELLKLPGIGPYTAGAIASIAFGERVAAVDGNVLRILSRLHAYDGPINIASSAKPLHTLAQALVPAHRPGDFNQALMDLGATICIPNGAPHCKRCPFAHFCLAHAQNLTGLLPIKKPKKARDMEQHTIVVLRSGGAYFIRKRPNKGLLAGLWEFMDYPGALTQAAVDARLLESGVYPQKITNLGGSKHLFTHKEWIMNGWLVEVATKETALEGEWVTPDALMSTYALASAIHFYRNQIINLL